MTHLDILLVEDHDLVSSGVQQTLRQAENYSFSVSLATDADIAFTLLQKQRFDIVLLDIVLKNNLPEPKFIGGDGLFREILKMTCRPKVIVLSKIDSLDMLDYIINILGADGYILKSRSSLEEIIPAIESIIDEQNFYSKSIERILRYNESHLEIDFTDRAILNGLSNGLTQKGIVIFLKKKDITMTVSAIEKRICRLKLRIYSKTTAQLIATAIKEGIA